MMKDEELFNEFIGKEVKAPYQDGPQFKIARGILMAVSDNFIKFKGKSGVLVVHKNMITKVGLHK